MIASFCLSRVTWWPRYDFHSGTLAWAVFSSPRATAVSIVLTAAMLRFLLGVYHALHPYSHLPLRYPHVVPLHTAHLLVRYADARLSYAK